MIAKPFTGIQFRDFSKNKKRKVSSNINFSIVNQCHSYQICHRNSNFVITGRDTQYTDINIILSSNIRKKRILNLAVI